MHYLWLVIQPYIDIPKTLSEPGKDNFYLVPDNEA